MNWLSYLDIRQTLWGKATASQWLFALRGAIAMCLALVVAFLLQLDDPYWAMTSTVIVMVFTSAGAVVSKSLARIFGSILGATAAVVIAGNTLDEPWFFSLAMALWLSLCTYISYLHQNNKSYFFALSGYTAAIVGFSVVNQVNVDVVFDIAQARVSEVVTGIICGGVMMFILPGSSDRQSLLQAIAKLQTELLEYSQLLLTSSNQDEDERLKIRQSHESIIAKVLGHDLLRTFAQFTSQNMRREKHTINRLLHLQLDVISSVSSLRRMLLNWPVPPNSIHDDLKLLLEALASPDMTQYHISIKLAKLKEKWPCDLYSRAFMQRLKEFCHLYVEAAENYQYLTQKVKNQRAQSVAFNSQKIVYHIDRRESFIHSLRVFFCILLGCWFWMSTQWDYGSVALTLSAISLMLYSASPKPLGVFKLMTISMLILVVFVLVIKFGLMIQISSLTVFLLFLFPLLTTMQLCFLRSKKYGIIWMQLMVFMGSFLSIKNPPEYDYQAFLNSSFAQIAGVLLAAVMIQVLKPSSDIRKGYRLLKSMREDFKGQLSVQPLLQTQEFESLIYHRIHLSRTNASKELQKLLLCWGIVLLNSHRIVVQLNQSARTTKALRQRRLCFKVLSDVMVWATRYFKSFEEEQEWAEAKEAFDQLITPLVHEFEAHQDDCNQGAILCWRLYCSLMPLRPPLI